MPTTTPAPEQRFSDRVENYIKYRPGYPPQILSLLQSHANLNSNSVVADIGSGTGISTEFLLAIGCKVLAVEPNLEMRSAAERLLSHQPNFMSINGIASATTLDDASVDLIVAAQAFHWFNQTETRAEFSRILKPQGQIALIWNERKLDGSEFLKAYETLLLKHGTDYASIRHENVDTVALTEFFHGPFTEHSFANSQRFDFAGLKGRLLSCSYAPAIHHPGHAAMITELENIYQKHAVDDCVTFEYRTVVYLGR